MTSSTRDTLLKAAQTLFAQRGFYGVSIANIADELGLTKQALLHHFSSKEKLYGEVLAGISKEFEALRVEAEKSSTDPVDRIVTYFTQVTSKNEASAEGARLVMRELLDNRQRAETASTWYLKPFLDALIEMVKATPRYRSVSDAEALAAVYALLGAVNYFAISEPTLRAMFGTDLYEDVKRAFPQQIERQVRLVID